MPNAGDRGSIPRRGVTSIFLAFFFPRACLRTICDCILVFQHNSIDWLTYESIAGDTNAKFPVELLELWCDVAELRPAASQQAGGPGSVPYLFIITVKITQ